MPVHLSSFFLAQRKWIVLFAVFTTIVSALALFRGYIYGSLVNTLVSAVADQTTQAFLLAMVVIIGTELVLFALRIPYDFIYSRCRGYMNIHARVFGVDRIITQQYQALAKMGSGKLLQIVHNGME
jgi:ABC-type multidrug transport system fused ATPase/permease subunit